jgi:hypothetical protein
MLFAIGVVIDMFLVILISYTDTTRTAFLFHSYVSYWGVWTGLRLLHGMHIPFTRAVQIVASVYVVIFAGLQAFALGFIVDLLLSGKPMLGDSSKRQ